MQDELNQSHAGTLLRDGKYIRKEHYAQQKLMGLFLLRIPVGCLQALRNHGIGA